MRNRKKIIVGVVFAFAVIVLMLGIARMNTKVEGGLFSWKKEAIDNPEKLFDCMETLGVTEVYQYMSNKVDVEPMKAFLIRAKEREVDVFYLTGEPDWAMVDMESKLIREIDKVRTINELSGDAAFKGIVFDVEPHALGEWKENADELMESYLDNMKVAYTYAQEHDVTMILCIPYHYDITGYEKELEALIAQSCDGIAIMNYYRDKEIENMQTEAAYANKYDKFIITIYEMKAAGTHGLTEKNTYHKEGCEQVRKNFEKLRKEFNGQNVKMAYHDYEAIKEVMKNR